MAAVKNNYRALRHAGGLKTEDHDEILLQITRHSDFLGLTYGFSTHDLNLTELKCHELNLV